MSNSLNGKKNRAGSKVSADVFTDMISKIVGIYAALMLAVFPLFATDMYYNILNDKFYFFFYSTLAAAVIVLMILLVGIAGGALRRQKDGTLPLRQMFRFRTEDWIFLAFLAVITVSTISSEWVYESFWGNTGRLQGMFFYLVIAVSWVLVTRFLKYRPFYLYLFLAVGVLVCLWGVTDYFGLDIFGWRADADDYWAMLVFASSIGNVNTFTAIAALYFGASAVLCLGKKHLWFLIPVYFICSLALITGTSDNAFLAVCGTFLLLPFYVAGDRERIPGFVLLLALFLLAMALTGAVTAVWTFTPVQTSKNWGALLKISNKSYLKLFVIAGLLFLGAAALFAAGRKTRLFTSAGYSPKKVRMIWAAVCVLAFAAVCFCFYSVNNGNNLGLSKQVRKYLKFNDRWGTNRGYAWRSTFEFFSQFGIFKKLFGSGPETFAIFMAKNYYYEMLEFMDSVFDSPHSEPLQYLFTTGIFGFICHYGLMGLAFLRGFRAEGHAAAFAFALAAYLCASLINVSVPITTPLFFMAAALALTVKENEEQVTKP